MTAVCPPAFSSNLPKTNRKIRTDRPRTLSHPNRINLDTQQTEVVSRLLSQDIEITSKDEAFRLEVNVLQFLQKLYGNLRKRGIYVLSDGIRLVGSVASCLVSSELESELNAINDLDLSIYIDPASEMPESLYFSILQAQEEALHYFVKNQLENRLTWKEIFEAFFVEVNKVEDVEGGESWSLLSVGSTYTIDIKYILQTKRKYAFSADSLEIILNPFLKVVNQAAAGPSTKQNLITQVESTYGDTRDAIQHVQSKLIKTKEPTQIRRGIFRFCLELAKGRKCELESEYQEYITVFGNAFFEEFSALPHQGEEEFKVYLEKFISKHPTHAAGILSSLRSVLCHLDTQPNRDKYLEILTEVEKNSDL